MTKTITGPKGWQRDQVFHRRDSITTSAPLTFDADTRSVDAVLSMGSPVRRIFGTEILRITPEAVDVSRIRSGVAPLLDSHANTTIKNTLGKINRSWFSGGGLHGRLTFAQTAEGENAMGMVQRGEITGVSLGYSISAWRITDEDNDVVDPETQRISWDANLTFEATRWQILECSLVSTPADSSALIRGCTGHNTIIDDVRMRMLVRERMAIRQAMFDRHQEIWH